MTTLPAHTYADVHAAYQALRAAQQALNLAPATVTSDGTAIMNLKLAERLLAGTLGLPTRTDA